MPKSAPPDLWPDALSMLPGSANNLLCEIRQVLSPSLGRFSLYVKGQGEIIFLVWVPPKTNLEPKD